jgi:hypothetical protein
MKPPLQPWTETFVVPSGSLPASIQAIRVQGPPGASPTLGGAETGALGAGDGVAVGGADGVAVAGETTGEELGPADGAAGAGAEHAARTRASRVAAAARLAGAASRDRIGFIGRQSIRVDATDSGRQVAV